MNMKRIPIFLFSLTVLLVACRQEEPADFFIMDSVFSNSPEGETLSAYNDPDFLKNQGYDAKVLTSDAQSALLYNNVKRGIVARKSDEYRWIKEKARVIDRQLKACRKAQIASYSYTDLLVLPQSVWDEYAAEINSEDFSIQQPLVQDLLKAQVEALFDRFPDLDGLVISTSDARSQDLPYHTAQRIIRQGEAGLEDHIKLISILREEVCVKRHKMLFYRTWDEGFFHTQPEAYLTVTEQIATHPNLVFSIKHTAGDFVRTMPFNPTIGVGKHKQIVEVQCQREYEGNGAHPNYIGESVINAFQENLDNEGLNGLNDFKNHPNFAGVWTWSRGGGESGPYLNNELWCELNAYVVSHWAQQPDSTEEAIFFDFCEYKGIKEDDLVAFRNMALYSTLGVFQGALSQFVDIDPFWKQDDFLGGVAVPDENGVLTPFEGCLNQDFEAIIDKDLVDEVINEKIEAVNLWMVIEDISRYMTSGDGEFESYLRVSASYGRIKYDIICQGWIIMLKGMEGDRTGEYDTNAILTAKAKYDELWKDFERMQKMNRQCASFYHPYRFAQDAAQSAGVGLDKAIHYYVDKVQQ